MKSKAKRIVEMLERLPADPYGHESYTVREGWEAACSRALNRARAILAEPDPPTSADVAEIVIWLDAQATIASKGCPPRSSIGPDVPHDEVYRRGIMMGQLEAFEQAYEYAWSVLDQQHQCRVLVVQLLPDEWDYLDKSRREGWINGDVKAGVILEQAARVAYLYQLPHPKESSDGSL